MEKTIWIAFDLGVVGDYDGLYAWLDSKGAKECGDGVAVIRNFTYSKDLVAELRQDVSEHVTTDKKTRIYVIRQEEKGLRGTFLLGKRKSAPWSGYGPENGGEEDDEA